MNDKELKQISCDPDCRFMIRNHNEDGVVTMAKIHTKKAHKISPSNQEMKEMIVTV